MVADDDLRVEVFGRRSGLRAGNAQNDGEYCTGDGEEAVRTGGVIGWSDSVHNPPPAIVGIWLS